jgi:outer membrane protein assembly factor BamB
MSGTTEQFSDAASAIRRARRAGLLALPLAAVLLAGCAGEGPSLPKLSDINPFKEKQVPLPGKRVAIMASQEKIPGELADGSQAIMLPPVKANDAWTQAGGQANNAPGNLALSGTRSAWTGDAGTGSGKIGRVTSPPVVAGGYVYTLDADAQVTAFNVGSGGAAWRASLAPTIEKVAANGNFSFSNMLSLGGGGGNEGGGYGGGLAVDNGRLYGTSGYGGVIALDPASGKRLWEKNLNVPLRAAPTAVNDKVYVISSEGRFFCLNGADGNELWSVRGLPQQASLVMNVSPAIDGDIVVVPYSSGDLVALKASDGSAAWSESLSRTRTTSQLASLSDAARPAIDSGVVFAVGHAGRMIATQARTGERLWSLNVPGTQMPWVAGGSVFVVDTQGQLMAVGRSDGKVQWTMKLPGSTWSGPTMAGSKLWLVSNKGLLVGVDAATGKLESQQEIGDPVFIAPVVAQGKMFILTDKAKLYALN